MTFLSRSQWRALCLTSAQEREVIRNERQISSMRANRTVRYECVREQAPNNDGCGKAERVETETIQVRKEVCMTGFKKHLLNLLWKVLALVPQLVGKPPTEKPECSTVTETCNTE